MESSIVWTEWAEWAEWIKELPNQALILEEYPILIRLCTDTDILARLLFSSDSRVRKATTAAIRKLNQSNPK